ncbi:TonB-dependent receptor plug domain-containing protein [Parahaliea aestuarii]|uniref:TonB-dependent receptor n=1 Tax=Parahaliea aestuarii TaxID=1852021 RepID=A0A5C8ZM92_9GAMM|nr:TonB-dependent receptor [Parahaliea aestuarii]TXS89305.1 TonB-dependent receptor [Parahaliea aestuarii]
MQIFRRSKLAWAVAAQVTLTAGYSPVVNAQDDTALEEVVVTGTRREARSVFDSAAPIDVLSGDEFRNQGASDLTTLLRNTVPSYNVNSQPISDAATVVRPANMRGLASDHTLVLVNGKRRHRAAVISWLGNGVNDGAQGPDISVIPAIALKQVEVLRDGAAAQYGSDAIAGVVNFILKDYSEGGSIEAKYGQYTEESDEAMYAVAGNIGLPFTANGFVNASFEYGESDPTNRSVQRDDAAALIAGGNTAVADPAQIWGNPEIEEDLKTFFNLGLNLSGNTEAYAFGNYASKEVTGGFYFRNPDTRAGVFGAGTDADGNNLRLVGDITDDLSGNCPTNLRTDDAAGLQAVIDDPDCFVFNEMFPGGFTPSFGAETEDYSFVAGARGTTDGGLAWDVSGSVGYNDADFFIINTVNASLGPQSPTEFDPGAYTQFEKNFNVDVSYPVDIGLASDLNIAGGFEWRDEEFEITIGDQASWEVGALADQGFSAASNGFPGFGPLAAGDWSRSNIAAYIDLEADVTDNWLLAVAVRWEDFDDFGTTTNGKVATHFQVTDTIGVRGSWSTGFRAPTPGQSNAYNVSTEFNLATNELENNGTIPATSPVAALRGGQPLDPEESTNYTAGLIFELGSFAVTVDYFNIDVDDRLGTSQNFELTEAERDALIAQGVAGANSLSTFRFFANGFDTNTEGFDVVATYSMDSSFGVTDFNLAYNQTETTVESFVAGLIDEVRIQELEEALPETRWNVMANHTMGGWRFMARYSYFDDWYDSEDTLPYDGYGVVDAEVGYSFDNPGFTVVVGADNLFDETPDENPNAAAGVGNLYSQWSPGGFNGRFAYVRLMYDF